MEMINLLPPDDRRQLQAARSNLLLLRYNVGLVFAAIFLGLATLAIYFILTSMHQAAEKNIADNQAKVSNFSTVRAQEESYRKNLTDAKALFDEEIQYSKLYLDIARALPEGTALQSLDLNPAMLGTPQELPVKIRGEKQAEALLTALQSSALFNNAATYGTLTMNTEDDKATYPYIITVNVTLNKGAL
jgi:Tfp pilus assembly protein PilN